ncbi:hypothetical protein HWV62_11530 [Athelia sp. TMB]|nr:hypothetical protein HWV62_11530 [Athelia sp. TMB]
MASGRSLTNLAYFWTVKDCDAITADLRENEGEGAIDMVILATSIFDVSRSFENLLQEFAASPDPVLRLAGFEHVSSDVHMPTLDISTSDTTAASCLMPDDPQTWGYRPASDGSPSLVEDTTLSNPFKLHLVGHGWLDVLEELKNVVVFHNDLSYGYYWATASSTVCSQVNTPMLVTPRFRNSYSYLDDDRVLVTHPAAMSEVAATGIKALRTRDASEFLSSDPSGLGLAMGSHAGIRQAVVTMLSLGWARPKSGFEEWKAGVWARNDDVVARILSDL